MPDIRWLLLATTVLGLSLPIPAPDFVGRATWYAEPYLGRVMRNGEVYTGQEMTAAVDDAQWSALAECELTICHDARCIRATVTDSGYLARAGVTLDLSPVAFRALRDLDSPDDNDGIMEVRAWASAPAVAPKMP